MKKTITMILALAATVASADTLGTATFNRTGTTVDTVTTSVTGDILTLSLNSLTITGENNTDFKPTNANTLTPNINVGNADNKSWTLSFTLTNTSSDVVTVDSIALSAFGTNGSNDVQTIAGGMNAGTWADTQTYYVGFEGSTQNKPVDFTITGAGTTWAINMGMPSGTAAGSVVASRTATFTLSTPWTLAAGESVTFDVTAENSNLLAYTSGTYAGINQIVFSGSAGAVPEPAPATLSLLALAGLAARRRRK